MKQHVNLQLQQFLTSEVNPEMTEEDPSLASKCMEVCQVLASQGQFFNFSFSLDTRSKAITSQGTNKMSSPSTLRRNARRREEFLARKQQETSTQIFDDNSAASQELKCDQSEYVAATETAHSDEAQGGSSEFWRVKRATK